MGCQTTKKLALRHVSAWDDDLLPGLKQWPAVEKSSMPCKLWVQCRRVADSKSGCAPHAAQGNIGGDRVGNKQPHTMRVCSCGIDYVVSISGGMLAAIRTEVSCPPMYEAISILVANGGQRDLRTPRESGPEELAQVKLRRPWTCRVEKGDEGTWEEAHWPVCNGLLINIVQNHIFEVWQEARNLYKVPAANTGGNLGRK